MISIKKYREYLNVGRQISNDSFHLATEKINEKEASKSPSRTVIINYLLETLNRDTVYLEIGVHNPNNNFAHIGSKVKYSVDPGVEFKENPVDFKMTSDAFFEQLRKGSILSADLKFDVIFIDGLHTAAQVDIDIANSLEFIREDGFIVLHDCNPPTEWHAREEHYYTLSPAKYVWTGTTWKAFVKWRQDPGLYSCCIDTDWGVGIISRAKRIGNSFRIKNEFYEFNDLQDNREEYLNLISFDRLKEALKKDEF